MNEDITPCPACGSIEFECNDNCPFLAEIREADGDARTNEDRYEREVLDGYDLDDPKRAMLDYGSMM